MCGSCGGGHAGGRPAVHERMLASNDRAARRNREEFREHDVFVVNLLGGPGSGKTALLEATIGAIGSGARLGVLAGDQATDADAARLRAAGVPAESIVTGSACHLDAEMVRGALRRMKWRDFDDLFIENVGNLVCPALYDLGQDVNVVALAVTDGEDKPIKYPTIFQKADLVLLTTDRSAAAAAGCPCRHDPRQPVARDAEAGAPAGVGEDRRGTRAVGALAAGMPPPARRRVRGRAGEVTRWS